LKDIFQAPSLLAGEGLGEGMNRCLLE
jgi:hypothetical protein